MKYAKIIIMLALAILIVGVASVCASDVNDTATADTGQIELSAADESAIPAQGNDESSAPDSEILGEDTGTFSELYDEIQKGGDVTLKHKYYKYDSESAIKIVGDDRVIDGNGTVIDLAASSNNTEVFEIYGARVTIKNMTIINANYMVKGGAICFTEEGTVTNCNFINNHAPKGGAIYFFRGGEVSNCNFTNNTATSGSGGAIYVEHREFIVTNCNFTNNIAEGGSGGAIYYNNESRGNLIGSSFKDNKATGEESYGGAVYFNNGGNVTSCRFIDNMAPQRIGGAVYFYAGESSVADSVFINNSAGKFSAVHLSFGVGNISGCLFINNTAEFGIVGQAWESYEQMSVSNNIFLNNSVTLYVIDFADDSNLNVDCNWFGSDETDYANNPDSPNCKAWLFLNATANPDAISVGDASDILFKLQMYNSTSGNVTGYNNGLLYPVNLTVTPAKGNADKKSVKLNEPLTYTATSMGTGSITASIENVKYTIETTNLGLNSDLSVDFQEADYSNNTIIAINYNSSATGTVNITLKGKNGNNYTFTNLALNATILLPEAINADEYEVNVAYSGDNVFLNATATGKLNVNKANSTLIINDNVTFDYGTNGSTTVPYTNASGIVAEVIGQPNAIVVVNDTSITVSGLNAGNYTLTVTTITDANHNNITKDATITVNKLKTELTGNAITTTYNVNNDLVITLKDSNGKALSGAKVTVDLNGAKTYTTDSNGQLKVSTKGLAPKAYTAKVTFNGDTNYDKSTKDIKVTVKKATPKLTAKKKTFKTTPKTKKYTIVLKDNTGKAIKKAKVTLKVKGKTYKATTNSKGKAVFKIKNLKKKGTFKATVTYKGNKYYNKVSKKANIKVIVTFKTVSKGSKDKSTVKEIQQALKDHGYYLSYKGHYLKVDGKFKGCTERSVKEFQHDKDLKVTGKVDEKTAKKLGLI